MIIIYEDGIDNINEDDIDVNIGKDVIVIKQIIFYPLIFLISFIPLNLIWIYVLIIMFRVGCHFHSCLYSFTSMILVCFCHCRSFLLLSLIIISSSMFGCLAWTLDHLHFGLSKEPRVSSMTFELRIPWRSHCRIMGGVMAVIQRDKRKQERLLFRFQVVWL